MTSVSDLGTDGARTRSLQSFRGDGYDKGRSVLWQAAWFAVMNLVFSRWWCPLAWRPVILKAFGAQIGEGTVIRHRVRVLWPWKLTLGDHTWIGEGTWLLNLEPIHVGSNVCLSQDVFLCTGSHDRHSQTFEYDNGQITISDEAWLGTQALILRGTKIGSGAVVGARAIITRDIAAQSLVKAGEVT
jgi:putative colanic acid biosynthesis acetyltransferase WcaF